MKIVSEFENVFLELLFFNINISFTIQNLCMKY